MKSERGEEVKCSLQRDFSFNVLVGKTIYNNRMEQNKEPTENVIGM